MTNKESKRYEVSLTEGEIRIIIEAVGAYKSRIKSKADRMATKRGVNHNGKSHHRLCYINTGGRKLSKAYGGQVDLPEGMYPRHKGHRKKNKVSSPEEVLLQKILYIGNSIPFTLGVDNRPKFIVLGTPQEFIDELSDKKNKKKVKK